MLTDEVMLTSEIEAGAVHTGGNCKNKPAGNLAPASAGKLAPFTAQSPGEKEAKTTIASVRFKLTEPWLGAMCSESEIGSSNTSIVRSLLRLLGGHISETSRNFGAEAKE